MPRTSYNETFLPKVLRTEIMGDGISEAKTMDLSNEDMSLRKVGVLARYEFWSIMGFTEASVFVLVNHWFGQ